eukprot:2969338-Amphidinium_carterae.1
MDMSFTRPVSINANGELILITIEVKTLRRNARKKFGNRIQRLPVKADHSGSGIVPPNAVPCEAWFTANTNNSTRAHIGMVNNP